MLIDTLCFCLMAVMIKYYRTYYYNRFDVTAYLLYVKRFESPLLLGSQ